MHPRRSDANGLMATTPTRRASAPGRADRVRSLLRCRQRRLSLSSVADAAGAEMDDDSWNDIRRRLSTSEAKTAMGLKMALLLPKGGGEEEEQEEEQEETAGPEEGGEGTTGRRTEKADGIPSKIVVGRSDRRARRRSSSSAAAAAERVLEALADADEAESLRVLVEASAGIERRAAMRGGSRESSSGTVAGAALPSRGGDPDPASASPSRERTPMARVAGETRGRRWKQRNGPPLRESLVCRGRLSNVPEEDEDEENDDDDNNVAGIKERGDILERKDATGASRRRLPQPPFGSSGAPGRLALSRRRRPSREPPRTPRSILSESFGGTTWQGGPEGWKGGQTPGGGGGYRGNGWGNLFARWARSLLTPLAGVPIPTFSSAEPPEWGRRRRSGRRRSEVLGGKRRGKTSLATRRGGVGRAEEGRRRSNGERGDRDRERRQRQQRRRRRRRNGSDGRGGGPAPRRRRERTAASAGRGKIVGPDALRAPSRPGVRGPLLAPLRFLAPLGRLLGVGIRGKFIAKSPRGKEPRGSAHDGNDAAMGRTPSRRTRDDDGSTGSASSSSGTESTESTASSTATVTAAAAARFRGPSSVGPAESPRTRRMSSKRLLALASGLDINAVDR